MDKKKTVTKKTKAHLNWEVSEKKLLIECVKLKLPVIESNDPSHDADLAKQSAWLDVQDRFNTKNVKNRPLFDLQEQWRILKDGATKKVINYNGFQRPAGATNPNGLIKLEPVDLTEGDDEDMVDNDADANGGEALGSTVPNAALELDSSKRHKNMASTVTPQPNTARLRQPTPSKNITTKKSIHSIDLKLFKLEAHRKQLKMNEELHQRKLQIVNEERKLKLKYMEQDRVMQLNTMKEDRELKLEALNEERERKIELFKLQKEILISQSNKDPSTESSVDMPFESNPKRFKLEITPFDIGSGMSGTGSRTTPTPSDDARAACVSHFEKCLKLITDDHTFQIVCSKVEDVMEEAISGSCKVNSDFFS